VNIICVILSQVSDDLPPRIPQELAERFTKSLERPLPDLPELEERVSFESFVNRGRACRPPTPFRPRPGQGKGFG